MGDPPLFLGFLRGVPFGWTFGLWKEWLIGQFLLLAIFHAWDALAFRREALAEKIRDARRVEPLSICGGLNFLFLAAVIAGIVLLTGRPGACVAQTGIPERLLAAISCGAVLMGANSYIGNAPNFMIRSIVEEARVKMPSFFGYIGYALAILLPIYLLLTLLFFRG